MQRLGCFYHCAQPHGEGRDGNVGSRQRTRKGKENMREATGRQTGRPAAAGLCSPAMRRNHREQAPRRGPAAEGPRPGGRRLGGRGIGNGFPPRRGGNAEADGGGCGAGKGQRWDESQRGSAESAWRRRAGGESGTARRGTCRTSWVTYRDSAASRGESTLGALRSLPGLLPSFSSPRKFLSLDGLPTRLEDEDSIAAALGAMRAGEGGGPC